MLAHTHLSQRRSHSSRIAFVAASLANISLFGTGRATIAGNTCRLINGRCSGLKPSRTGIAGHATWCFSLKSFISFLLALLEMCGRIILIKRLSSSICELSSVGTSFSAFSNDIRNDSMSLPQAW